MTWPIAFAATALVMAGLDFVWLTSMSEPFYRRLLGHLMAPSPNMTAAVVFYVLYIVGILVFAVRPALADGDWRQALWLGAALGLVAYATYDLTNMATMRDWPLSVTLVDIAWGTFLTAVAATAGAVAALKVQT